MILFSLFLQMSTLFQWIVQSIFFEKLQLFPMNISKLSKECRFYLLKFLDIKSLLRLTESCYKFWKYNKDMRLWRSFVHRDFSKEYNIYKINLNECSKPEKKGFRHLTSDNRIFDDAVDLYRLFFNMNKPTSCKYIIKRDLYKDLTCERIADKTGYCKSCKPRVGIKPPKPEYTYREAFIGVMIYNINDYHTATISLCYDRADNGLMTPTKDINRTHKVIVFSPDRKNDVHYCILDNEYRVLGVEEEGKDIRPMTEKEEEALREAGVYYVITKLKV